MDEPAQASPRKSQSLEQGDYMQSPVTLKLFSPLPILCREDLENVK